ncbi:D-alanyl-D-alanine carboxypeptidase family protein [Agrobacterium radiobacter]|uniref:serine-type D-Ala-D-Ala carboxypeptidase n=1 Tax=Agrobacterium tumefaciens str. B6 TaxID=1183423 RepID=A0A822UXE7_AGRTU|nr:D-alanyl-D-alanine carboxypeptidase family protein [Agrobacterium tumefaciens]AYM05329.1 D-alanyl-D-alanine carboxypeptidase (penicillin-binding protein) [Agrobacterium tumefaciens]KWT84176.1 D-alanyl-D-alanine carboxypeptidase [Agrobacterium tumefaciens str. B6]MQB28765.1 D-alanyl-D-alanine carboxypeptidase [Agrobacterium tumefaciens]NSZ32175.1 D-alanyl-D-alanine carboxypeptidase [Agrobacterium tumefaciens]NTA04658.1 D-alanyl-D-alanine carboxypeptidase [Agrobacterium tumefaciens]
MRKAIHRSYCSVVTAAVLASFSAGPAQSQTAPFIAKAEQAYMIDAETGTVLLSQNENQPFPPASLAKLMTVEVVLDALSKGQVTPETAYPVSEYAWRTGGAPSRTSTMFAALKSSVSINDLLTGIIVQNANDGCIVIAEGMTGSDAAFAKRMTARAGELGMSRSTFTNSTGLPDPGNQTTARDMVRLAQHLHDTYPDRYGLFTKPDFEWNRIFQRNKNTLLMPGSGIDGLGLGFAEGSGFAAVVSAEREGRRVYLALSGIVDDKTRQEEARRVVDWGLTAFEKRHLFSKDEAVGSVSVYGGDVAHIDLSPKEDVSVLVPVNNPERISGRIVYRWPLNAPLDVGANAGTLRIFSGERLLREVPLYTKAAVGKGSLTQNATGALKELLLFWL